MNRYTVLECIICDILSVESDTVFKTGVCSSTRRQGSRVDVGATVCAGVQRLGSVH